MGVTVVLYSRKTCHLCDEARSVLVAERGRSPFDFEEVLIDGSDELEREYGLRVPVVVVDGSEAFEYQVDPGAFAAMIAANEPAE